MIKIGFLMRTGRVSRISELELARYTNFFDKSYKDNLNHCRAVKQSFPRWSIISGYYSMHDACKLLLTRKFRLKMELRVHQTTILVLKELVRNKEILYLIEKGYEEFITLANDLALAKKERVKSQYYTGTAYMDEEYRRQADWFLRQIVEPFITKLKRLE